MTIQWQSQTCLLTGATGGIGAAMAHALAKKGVTLILTGRSLTRLNELNACLPGQHDVVVADVSTHEGTQALVSAADKFAITMLINNAGVSDVGTFSNTSAETLEQVIALNLTVPMTLTQRLLPVLKRAPQAHIVNVGSIFGSIGFAAHGAYCASKFGLRGWTEAMMREFHGSTVQFYYLAPRATRTAINSPSTMAMNEALGNQVDEPDVVANALISQLSRGKKRQYLGTPENIFVRLNGLIPSLVDKALSKKLPVIERFTSNKESLS